MIQSKHTGNYFEIVHLLFLRLIVCCFRPESSKDPYYLTLLPTPGALSLESDNGQQPTDLLLRENKEGAQMKRR